MTSTNPPLRDWHGRSVWVVGASSGIGAALAVALCAAGATVYISARRDDALRALADRASGPVRPRPIPCDVTSADSVRAAHAEVLAACRQLDVVVWLAGTYQPMSATEYDLAVAQRIVSVNLGGLLNGLSVLLPTLLAQRRGALVLVASVAGYRGLPMSLVYGPTKAAMINMAEALFLELRPAGIGVHLVNPGFVETPLTALNRFPMPALITPEQAAAAILDGLGRGRFEISFPRRFTSWLKLLRIVPDRLYLGIVGRYTRPSAGPRA